MAYNVLQERLQDARGRRVAFVSHCLLNENTRYLGGAFRAGGVAELAAALLDDGVGICQMPCPEQRAWGGVLKRWMLRAYGTRGTFLYVLRGPLLKVFTAHTRRVYRRLARDVARQAADYERSGCTVVGIIGVGASPSCGVNTTLDLRCSLEAVAAMPARAATTARVNRDVVLASRRAGQGLFVEALRGELARRGLAVPFLEHDLVAEMRGERQRVWPP